MPNLSIDSINLPSSIAQIDPSLLKVVLVGLIVFVLAILLAFTRRHLIDTSLHGLFAGFITGAVALLIVEAALFFAFKNPSVDLSKKLPPNLQAVFNDSRNNVTQVLGLETERKQPTPAGVVADFETLKKTDANLVLNSICK